MDAETTRPITPVPDLCTDAPVYVDNSRLSAFAQCNLKGWLRYARHWAKPDDSVSPARAGTSCHLAFETWAKGGTTEEALAAYEADYLPYVEGLAETILPEDRLHPDRVRACMEQWLINTPNLPGGLKIDPEMVEVGLQYQLLPATVTTPEVRFYGRADCIAFDQWGKFWIIDFKTTGSMDAKWAMKYKWSPQLLGYTRAAQRNGLGEPGGALIVGLGLRYSSSELATCQGAKGKGTPPHMSAIRTHKTTGAPVSAKYSECGHLHVKRQNISIEGITERSLDAWEWNAQFLAKQWVETLTNFRSDKSAAHVPALGPYTNSCGWCEFQSFCVADKPVHHLPTMFKQDPWTPYETQAQGDYA